MVSSVFKGLFLTVVIFTAALQGCSTKITYGTIPNTEALGSLSVGISRAPEVEQVLGKPRGKGSAFFESVGEPREIWSYEYTESEGSQIRLKMLLVFMNGQIFDGYLWFSSVDAMSSETLQ